MHAFPGTQKKNSSILAKFCDASVQSLFSGKPPQVLDPPTESSQGAHQKKKKHKLGYQLHWQSHEIKLLNGQMNAAVKKSDVLALKNETLAASIQHARAFARELKIEKIKLMWMQNPL